MEVISNISYNTKYGSYGLGDLYLPNKLIPGFN